MKISLLSIFPESFSSFLATPVARRAMDRGTVDIQCIDIKDFAEGSFRKIDDSPYGGGPGMVLRVDTVCRAIDSVRQENSRIVLLSPKGRPYDQAKARELSRLEHLVLVSGHYEGFDERVRAYVDEEISIGDYILTGGELASQVICDSVVRLLDGSLREGSAEDESFETGLLEYPHYTHPLTFDGKSVPEVLLSGNDAKIKAWRLKQAIIETIKYRPDLFDAMPSQGIGMSGSKVLFLDGYVLKIQPVGPVSEREVLALRWLSGKLPVPEVLYHENRDGLSYLLMDRLKGRMLCESRILHNRRRLLKSCAAALKMLWSVDLSDCPFLEEGRDCEDAVLSHGDFCLPNILCDNDGITGFLDLGYCTISSRESDIETCLESLEENLIGKYSDGTETEGVDRSDLLDLL